MHHGIRWLLVGGLVGATGFAISRAADTPRGPVAEAATIALTETQRREASRVLAPLRDRIRETARASGRARRRLFEATQQSPFDEQAIRAAARESARCEEDLSVLRGRVADELRKILTAEQRRAMDRAAELFADALEKRASEAGSLVDAWLDQNPAGGPR